MSKEYDKDKLLKEPKIPGKLLLPEHKGDLLKPKKKPGKPLWIEDETLNEEKKKKKKLNE